MTVTLTLTCHKCGNDNPIEAKRCRSRSCQAWFKSAERTAEWKQKSSESNKKYWNRFYATEDNPISIVKNGKRKWPDFYNPKTRRVVELLGTYWHRDRILPEGKTHATPEELISWYKESDWDCIVLWENEVENFKNTFGEVA